MLCAAAAVVAVAVVVAVAAAAVFVGVFSTALSASSRTGALCFWAAAMSVAVHCVWARAGGGFAFAACQALGQSPHHLPTQTPVRARSALINCDVLASTLLVILHSQVKTAASGARPSPLQLPTQAFTRRMFSTVPPATPVTLLPQKLLCSKIRS